MWAGFIEDDIVTGTSGITNIPIAWENQNYESLIASLEVISGFTAWCDCDGKLHFEQIPDEGTPEAPAVTVDLVYEEGADRTRIGRVSVLDEYTISWMDLHRYLVFVAYDCANPGQTIQALYDFTSTAVLDMLVGDIMVVHVEGVSVTQAQLDAVRNHHGRRDGCRVAQGGL